MPSLYSSAEAAPPINGSCRSPIDKPAFSSSLFPSSPTYPVHGGVAGAGFSDANVNGSVYFNTPKLTDRRMHNALQPISRLNSDILEHLFLTGAFLVASHDAPSHRHSSSSLSSSSRSTSLTHTVLTYAQLTSSLRRIALRSARLWALLVDFERPSFEWNAELLRRSAGVGLQVVWQWSKAAGAGADSGIGARSKSGSGRGRVDLQEWDWESNDRVTARQRKRREDGAKRARLDKVLQKSVLERATSLGFAVPAPYFTSILLERLGSPDEVLPELESLRIVRSRPRRASTSRLDVLDGDEEEDDNNSGKELYVPLGVVANAPRLRRLAIAECNLSFHQLLPSFSSLSSSSQSAPDFSALSNSSPPTFYPFLNALHTLRHLQSLQIADLPLRTAPSAREWLRYLTFMPALEELVLEGAVLRKMDLILRDKLKAGSEDGSGGVSEGESGTGRADRSPHGERRRTGEGGGDTREVDEETTTDWSTLPKLKILTLDAALEDVAVFATNLPLPSHTSRGRQMKWRLLCANADASDLDDVEKVVDLFASAVSGGASVGSCAGDALSSPTESFPSLCLSVKSTESDVYVHLSATTHLAMDASPTAHISGADSTKSHPEAGFSIFMNLHSIGGGIESSPLAPNRMTVEGITRSATAPPSMTLLPPVLATLAHNVLPQVASLELELSPASPSHSAGLTEVLRQARSVEVLTLGTKDARKVLRMLHGEHKRSFSLDSQLSSSSESESSSVGDPVEESTGCVLLPSMRTLCLDEENATGPTWTTLLRFVKARMANGVPVQRIEFNERETEQPHTQQFVTGVAEGRIKELEGMGVKVAAYGR